MHNTLYTRIDSRSVSKHFCSNNPTYLTPRTLHTPLPQPYFRDLNPNFISNPLHSSKLKTKQENKGKLTLILLVGSKEALKPKNTKISTFFLLDFGSDTVHPSPRCKSNKSRMKLKKITREIHWKCLYITLERF